MCRTPVWKLSRIGALCPSLTNSGQRRPMVVLLNVFAYQTPSFTVVLTKCGRTRASHRICRPTVTATTKARTSPCWTCPLSGGTSQRLASSIASTSTQHNCHFGIVGCNCAIAKLFRFGAIKGDRALRKAFCLVITLLGSRNNE